MAAPRESATNATLHTFTEASVSAAETEVQLIVAEIRRLTGRLDP